MGIKNYNILTVLALSAVSSISAFADGNTVPQPSWMTQSVVTADPNVGILSNTSVSSDATFSEKLFKDSKDIANLKQQYDDLNRYYAMRTAYGIADLGDVQNSINANQDFGHNILHQVEGNEASTEGKTLDQNTQGDEGLRNAAKPVGVAVAVYTGKQVKVKLDDDTKLVASSTLRDRKAQMGIESPIVSTHLEVCATAPSQYSQDNVNAGIQDPNAERYRFSMDRKIPILDIKSAVSYGSTSNTVNASLSRVLVANLSASVNAIRPMTNDYSVSPPPQETVSLSYGLHF